jgi:hypothetical protein
VKLKDICALLKADAILISDDSALSREFKWISATDLMSEALAHMHSEPPNTLLITGLVHAQSLRTAEMLDIEVLIYVYGKKLNEVDFELAKSMGKNVFVTPYSMYDACGILYQNGLMTAMR